MALDGNLNSLGLAKAPEDTRVIVAMSGGVDSSVVAAELARPQRAHLRHVARRVRAQHTRLRGVKRVWPDMRRDVTHRLPRPAARARDGSGASSGGELRGESKRGPGARSDEIGLRFSGRQIVTSLVEIVRSLLPPPRSGGDTQPTLAAPPRARLAAVLCCVDFTVRGTRVCC